MTSAFSGNQLVVAFSSPNNPGTANERSVAGLFTIDFSFGSSLVNNTTLASYVNTVGDPSAAPAAPAAPGYLDPIGSSGPNDLQLSFHGLDDGDKYTFNGDRKHKPPP